MRSLRKWMLLLALAPLPAFGQACGGFVDVSPANFFCNDVEWIKNRGVTLGCTATQYCPNNNVLRSQMAAFLARLGRTLTPTIMRVTDSAFDGDYDPFMVGCISTPVPPGDNPHPRQASFVASLWNFGTVAVKLVAARLVYSTDGGANWTPTADFEFGHTLTAGEHKTLALNGGPLDLDTTSTYLFAIRTTTNNPGVMVSGDCQMTVRIENRTSLLPPF
jgi:hypothetical protein